MADKDRAVWKSRIPALLSLKGELEGRKIQPSEVAKAIGVTKATVYTWLSNEGVPTISADMSAKLARYFGVQVWRLWELDESEDEPGQWLEREAV